jgi:hypothetical protein
MEDLLIYVVLMKINTAISLHHFLLLSEVEIQAFLHPPEANLG